MNILILGLELILRFVSGESRLTQTLLGWVLLGLIWICPVRSWAEAGPHFNREVRPVLSQYCFKCHGPDEAARQSGLRLDSQGQALAAADSGLAAVVPGDPEQSELVRRIFSVDEFEVMPPPEAKMPLTNEQRDVLRRWTAHEDAARTDPAAERGPIVPTENCCCRARMIPACDLPSASH